MTKSGGELFRMIIRLKNILKQSALAITRFFGSLENDKFLFTAVPTITVTYPYWRSQIPRCALNDGWGWSRDWHFMRWELLE
jgi:hypothetical protein